jgi:hypothetical protein
MLAAAILAIQNSGRFGFDNEGITPILDTDSFLPHAQSMYID